MGRQLDEMKEMFLPLELRMEVQLAELTAQMNAQSAAARGEKPTPTYPLQLSRCLRALPVLL